MRQPLHLLNNTQGVITVYDYPVTSILIPAQILPLRSIHNGIFTFCSGPPKAPISWSQTLADTRPILPTEIRTKFVKKIHLENTTYLFTTNEVDVLCSEDDVTLSGLQMRMEENSR